MLLSEHFLLEEFLRSEVAARMGEPITTDDPAIIACLKLWCQSIGEPLRTKLGRPIVVLSGYRPSWLNTAVGGAKDSAHMYGRAADVLVPGLTPVQVSSIVAKSQLPFDQVILEFGQWCHIGIAPQDAKPRGEVLTAESLNGLTHYVVGIQPPLAAHEPQESA